MTRPVGWRLVTAAAVFLTASCAGVAPPDRPAEPSDPATVVRSVAPRATYGIYTVDAGRCTRSAGLDTDRVLPIASVFKLWILDALAREIQAGRARWNEPFPVRDDLRSDPSGEVYALPRGKPLSLRRYAELMISISDNSAADHLLARLGRPTVEATLGAIGISTTARNAPLVSTAELARLKFVSPAAGERYLGLTSVPERRAFLTRLPDQVPFPWAGRADRADRTGSGEIDLSHPRKIDELEWFATADDLCRTMADLDRLAAVPGLEPVAEILGVNPGTPPEVRNRWAYVGYKGGSEPGVLTAVFLLHAKDGSRRVAVLAWSDPERLIEPDTDGEAALRAVLRFAESHR